MIIRGVLVGVVGVVVLAVGAREGGLGFGEGVVGGHGGRE